jgi:hypothetical protein
MPFEYTPLKPRDHDDYWSEQNKARAATTPKADTSQIPALHDIYSNSPADAAQAAREAEIEASPYAFSGRGLTMTPRDHARWKEQFFAEKETSK